VDIEAAVRPRLIGFIAQIALQLRQLAFLIELERGDTGLAPFALACGAIGDIEILKRADGGVEITVGFDRALS